MNPPNEVKKEEWEAVFDRIWSRAHIPDFANDAKSTLKSLIHETLKSDRERIRSGIEALIEKVAMSPHFPGGALEQKKRFQLEILNDVLKLISDKE